MRRIRCPEPFAVSCIWWERLCFRHSRGCNTALHEVGSQYLRTEFRRNARRFLKEIVKCVLSTVASRSVIGQGICYFCPAVVVGGDDVAPFQLFNKLLDGFLENGWTRGNEVEASRAEYHYFAPEQRQLERSSSRSHLDVGDVLSLCSAQAGFGARQHLYKVCIVSNRTCCSDFHELLFSSWDSAVSAIPVDNTCDPWACNYWRKTLCQPRLRRHQRRGSACCPTFCAWFCSEPALHTEKFLLRVWLDNVVWVCCYRRKHYIKSGPCPVEYCGVSMCEPSHHWSACSLGSGCVAPSHCQRKQWAMVSWWHPRNRSIIKAGCPNFRRRGTGRVE